MCMMFSHMSTKSVVENDAYAFGSVRHHVPCKWTDKDWGSVWQDCCLVTQIQDADYQTKTRHFDYTIRFKENITTLPSNRNKAWTLLTSINKMLFLGVSVRLYSLPISSVWRTGGTA